MSNWWDLGITQGYGQNGERGVDIGTPYQTRITAPIAGVVTSAGYHAWGGEVDIATVLPDGRKAIEYVLHLSTIAGGIAKGTVIQAGQLLGLSGGQVGWGNHPTSPRFSTGPHTEVGFYALGNSAQTFNPRPILAAVDKGSTALGVGGSSTSLPCPQGWPQWLCNLATGTAGGFGVNSSNAGTIAAAANDPFGTAAKGAQAVGGWMGQVQSWLITAGERVGFFVLALTVIIFGLYLLFKPQIDDTVRVVGKTATTAAVAAAA